MTNLTSLLANYKFNSHKIKVHLKITWQKLNFRMKPKPHKTEKSPKMSELCTVKTLQKNFMKFFSKKR